VDKNMNFLKILKCIDNLNSDSIIKTIINSVNKDQIENKKWLIEKLTPYLHLYEKPKILVVAGWYGLLSDMLSKQIDDVVHSSDKDINCAKIGIKMFDNKVKYITKDIADYKEHHLKNYDVLICTSCEHIDDLLINSFISKKRKDSLIVLQSNNFIGIKDHINCKKSLKDFKNSINLNVQYEEKKSFEKYDRYMIIGT
tara:strand:+ start:4440 stop:5033 length:594 start_codon:yes stop_codon:yes gene_type:complete